MIGKLSGVVEEVLTDSILLDIQGVGYIVYVAKKFLDKLHVGCNAKLYIEQQIAENIIRLYGFESKKEQEVIRLLIKVKGINYKIALNLIDQIGVGNLILSIQQKNDQNLKIKGIGDKLTKRIITEAHGDFLKVEAHEEKEYLQKGSNFTESVSALCNLGFNQRACLEVVSDILKSNEMLPVSDIVVLALKKL